MAAKSVKKPTEPDLFASGGGDYTAKDIEVLEGLEPVRKRPGMYIGGTDEKALHHLFAEVLDNAMDEAVAGHASRIEVEFLENGYLAVTDNGRGVPVDPHPKFKNKSALEVIMTTLHSGAKFEAKAYQTSGGLHGVGVSVVNALSDDLTVEVCRNRTMWRQTYSKGHPTSKLKEVGPAPNRRGTTVTFHPDPEIFGAKVAFKPARLYRMARSKAYLFGGVEIRWRCAPSLIKDETPAEAVFRFEAGPHGLSFVADQRQADRHRRNVFRQDRPQGRRRPWRGRMGGMLGRRRVRRGRRLRPLLLQHDPDGGRRHA